MSYVFGVCVCVVCNFTIKHVFPKNKIQNLDVGEHNFTKLLVFNVLFKLYSGLVSAIKFMQETF